jgi:hypothetical protein
MAGVAYWATIRRASAAARRIGTGAGEPSAAPSLTAACVAVDAGFNAPAAAYWRGFPLRQRRLSVAQNSFRSSLIGRGIASSGLSAVFAEVLIDG